MTLLTTEQVTEIADALEALGAEFEARDWDPALAKSVATTAAGYLVSTALMRAPVPQQAYFAPPPPPYGYGPEDPGQSVPLSIQATGSSRLELEESAAAAGRQVFGEDAALYVTLTGNIVSASVSRDSVAQYQCLAIVREEGGQDGPVRESGKLPG